MVVQIRILFGCHRPFTSPHCSISIVASASPSQGRGLLAVLLSGGCPLHTVPQHGKCHHSLHIHGASSTARLHGASGCSDLSAQILATVRCARCPAAYAEVDFDRTVATNLSAWYRCPNEMASCPCTSDEKVCFTCGVLQRAVIS